MIKITNTEVVGFTPAIRGMRNPMNSWERSDTVPNHRNYIGPADLTLMNTLRKAGTDHRKFMRMMVVYCDIKAPLYWWKEFDTYKVGTVVNSCSTMHKIHDKEFTLEDFSQEHLNKESLDLLIKTIDRLNYCRSKFIETKEKDWWWQMIQLLPTSYMQLRTVMMNYEVIANAYKSRYNHKQDEWSADNGFCDWARNLPYSELITG